MTTNYYKNSTKLDLNKEKGGRSNKVRKQGVSLVLFEKFGRSRFTTYFREQG